MATGIDGEREVSDDSARQGVVASRRIGRSRGSANSKGARERRLAPWPRPTAGAQQLRPRYAVLALIAGLVLSALPALVLSLIGVHIPRVVTPLILEIALLATLVPLYHSESLKAADLGLRRVPGARSVGYALLGVLAYGFFSLLWRALVHPEHVRGNFAGIPQQSALVIVLAGLAATLGAPIVEEIFFRGVLYRSFRNRLGVLPASVIAGAIFGVLHTQYPLIVRPELAFFGVIAALLYERTGSLLPGIAMHSFIDASGFEIALTGRETIVGSAFLLIAVILLLRPPLKGLARLVTGKPVIRCYPEVAGGE